MKIEVWKRRLWGPRQVASSLWVVLSGNQPSVRFVRWSFDYLPIASSFAADALGGEVIDCPYNGMIAASKQQSAEYFFDLGYSPLLAADAITVTCERCGYGVSEQGKFQTIPHPPRSYVVALRRSAKIAEADFTCISDGGYFAQPQRNGRLIICRYGGGLFTNVPKWVFKQFSGGELLHATPTYAILVPL